MNDLIFDLLSKGEGTHGDYNIIFGGGRHGLTSMTINEVIDWQHWQIKKGSGFSASGKYQIIRKTLIGLKRLMKLEGTELFDKDMQDRMALKLLNDRGYQEFLDGKLSIDKFMIELSKEWASFPVPKGMNKRVKKNGKLVNVWLPKGSSYYPDGVNHARLSIEEVKDVLTSVRPIHQIDNDIVIKISWLSRLFNFITRKYNG